MSSIDTALTTPHSALLARRAHACCGTVRKATTRSTTCLCTRCGDAFLLASAILSAILLFLHHKSEPFGAELLPCPCASEGVAKARGPWNNRGKKEKS